MEELSFSGYVVLKTVVKPVIVPLSISSSFSLSVFRYLSFSPSMRLEYGLSMNVWAVCKFTDTNTDPLLSVSNIDICLSSTKKKVTGRNNNT